MAKRPHKGEMRHVVTITNWRETPDDDIDLVRERKPIFSGRAKIVERGYESRTRVPAYDTGQVSILPNASHVITIRQPSDVHITSLHWVYCVRRFGHKQWFRILLVKNADTRGDFLDLHCMLDEVDDPRTDPAVSQRNPDFEEPDRLLPGPGVGAV